MKKYLVAMLAAGLLFGSCKKSEDTEVQGGPAQTASMDSIIGGSTSTLVSALNGFRFEASFTNTEPEAYPYMDVAYIDDYNDSMRIVTVNQNIAQTITVFLASNHRAGLYTRGYDHKTFPNNQYANMKFSFLQPEFLLNWWAPATSELTTVGNVFGFNTSVSQSFTGTAAQYQYEFLNRYVIRYISGISIWPFHHQNWNSEPQFVATQELSEPKAWDHWYNEEWSEFPWDVKTNMYTGFLNVSNDTAYVGIAKGGTNLDTVHFRQATWSQFSGSCSGYLDKSGDTLFFGLINNIPGTSNMEISLYQYITTVGQLQPLYEKMPYPSQLTTLRFNKGNFYAINTATGNYKLDHNGSVSTFNYPTSSYTFRYFMSRNKLYVVMYDANIPRLEVYSKGI